MAATVQEIKQMLLQANDESFAVLERSLSADTRKGVRSAVESTRRRLEAQRAEAARLNGLYEFQESITAERGGTVILGLDEVGRGSIAGPLAVGGVVLPATPRIAGLNDSKQLSPAKREEIAAQIKEHAVAWTVQYVEPDVIDSIGMTASLRRAFSSAIAQIEKAGIEVDVVLLDGNAMHLDKREVNVIKGDARCASIAAASIVAKVERDALMTRYAVEYPQYDLEDCKGYGSAKHIAAIKQHGLSPIHRASFCTSFMQESLF